MVARDRAHRGLFGALVIVGRRGSSTQRAAFLGVAADASFGLTAAFITAVTNAAAKRGLAAIFTSWQTMP